jgi:hypothetical protein
MPTLQRSGLCTPEKEARMTDRIAARFLRFAEREADGSSPLYAALARGAAGDPFVLGFLAGLPDDKQQPNLLFAALRHVCGTPGDWAGARVALEAQAEPIRALMLARRTQTNEPARCATLLPVLARLPQPLALLEVGASAGLCLLPDRYGYAYGAHRIAPPSPEAPIFPARANTATPLPDALPSVVWRAGLDLSPVDLHDPGQCAWLETLVWPEHTDRLQRLRAAIRIAQADAPRLHQGDLLTDLAAVVRTAPGNTTLVVFHTAVLAYIADQAARDRFAQTVSALGAVWISNESSGVFPAIAARVRRPGPAGAFLLAVDGVPIAWTQPHGAWIEWLQPEDVPA